MTLLGLSPLCSPNSISNIPMEFLTFSSELLIIFIHYALAFLLINHLFTPTRLKPSFLSKVVKSLNINWADSQPLIKILRFVGLAVIANGTLHLIHLLMWKYPLNKALGESQVIIALIFFFSIGGVIQIINSYRVKKPLIESLTTDQIEDKISPSHSTLDKLRSN
ncbi:MAG: hypothetical protein ACRC78_16360, partial [Planktothrix sp.]